MKNFFKKLFKIETETFEQITKYEAHTIVFALCRRLDVINQDHIPESEQNYFYILETEQIKKIIDKIRTGNFISESKVKK